MDHESSFNRIYNVISGPLMLISLILGLAGFLYAGHSFSDALYGAIKLFGLNMSYDDHNIMIEIAKWLSPISLSTAIFTQARPLYMWLRDGIVFGLAGQRTIIYSDNYAGKALFYDLKLKGVMREGICLLSEKANRSIIIMSDDEKGLEIYRRLKEMDAKSIYLCQYSMEPALLPSWGDTVISNINDVIAAYFWRKEFFRGGEENRIDPITWYDGEKHIFDNDPERVFNIVIIDYNALGKRLLYKGLLMNIFSPDQSIRYHVLDEKKEHKLFKDEIKQAESLNGDKVKFYSNSKKLFSSINEPDAIILTNDVDPAVIQNLLYSTESTRIYYYDKMDINLRTGFSADYNQSKESTDERQDGCPRKCSCYDRLFGYGSDKEILKEKYILSSSLIENAKQLNHIISAKKSDWKPDNSMKDAIDEEWSKLSGFKKGSRVNAMDYFEIGAMVASWDKDWSDDQLAEMEHTRWARYYYLNHWNCGEEDDDSKRTHNYLRPYGDLPKEEDRKKAKRMVELWRQEKSDRMEHTGAGR